MNDEHDLDDDPIDARRRHLAAMQDLDRSIADKADPERIAERQAEAARRAKWNDTRPIGYPRGVAAHRLAEEEADRLDRSGY